MRERPYLRPVQDSDKPQLDQWRAQYQAGTLELPHGYFGDSVETQVAESPDGTLLLALTGTLVLSLDPLITNPDAKPQDIGHVLSLVEAILVAKGVEAGALDVYVAVPRALAGYISLLEHRGYTSTAEGCVIMRRSIVRPRPEVDKNIAESVP